MKSSNFCIVRLFRKSSTKVENQSSSGGVEFNSASFLFQEFFDPTSTFDGVFRKARTSKEHSQKLMFLKKICTVFRPKQNILYLRTLCYRLSGVGYPMQSLSSKFSTDENRVFIKYLWFSRNYANSLDSFYKQSIPPCTKLSSPSIDVRFKMF